MNYFNGGIFATPSKEEISLEELLILQKSARFNWASVRPDIFGAFFERSTDKKIRHDSGAHYTNILDIKKVTHPTISQPWNQWLTGLKNADDALKAARDLASYRVLDPACGSGNFLATAFRELKQIEKRLKEILASFGEDVPSQYKRFGIVQPKNFFGIDINAFAVEIAKTTLSISHHLSVQDLDLETETLPLVNLNANFICGDALLDQRSQERVWPEVDAIIGNPPFLGAKMMVPTHGEQYVKSLRKAYPSVSNMADFCVYWFYKCNEHLRACTIDRYTTGRAGLVGTHNIRTNASRGSGLQPICQTGTIIEAVDSQSWSGEAAVHVSIVNWVKTKDKVILPAKRKLWRMVETNSSLQGLMPRGSKKQDVEFCIVNNINSSLKSEEEKIDLAVIEGNVGVCHIGLSPRYNEGFLIEEALAEKFLGQDHRNSQVILKWWAEMI